MTKKEQENRRSRDPVGHSGQLCRGLSARHGSSRKATMFTRQTHHILPVLRLLGRQSLSHGQQEHHGCLSDIPLTCFVSGDRLSCHRVPSHPSALQNSSSPTGHCLLQGHAQQRTGKERTPSAPCPKASLEPWAGAAEGNRGCWPTPGGPSQGSGSGT